MVFFSFFPPHFSEKMHGFGFPAGSCFISVYHVVTQTCCYYNPSQRGDIFYEIHDSPLSFHTLCFLEGKKKSTVQALRTVHIVSWQVRICQASSEQS